MSTLPWLQAPWERLMQARWQQRLGHALLLSGAKGIGKRQFAHQLAASLLCQQPQADGQACGHCRGCELFQSGGHPDFAQVAPEEAGKPIRVDAVRALTETLALATNYGGFRVVILDPAEAMNLHAANSLLKTLEEPPGQNLIVLITERHAMLPATIRSRCQLVKLPTPAAQQAQDWLRAQMGPTGEDGPGLAELLALADGAPLAAKHLWEEGTYSDRRQAFVDLCDLSQRRISPVALAERWLKQGAAEPIHWLYQWLSDVAHLASGLPTKRVQAVAEDGLQARLGSVNLRRLYRLSDEVVAALRAEQGNLNTQMQLESLLMEWLNVLSNSQSARS